MINRIRDETKNVLTGIMLIGLSVGFILGFLASAGRHPASSVPTAILVGVVGFYLFIRSKRELDKHLNKLETQDVEETRESF